MNEEFKVGSRVRYKDSENAKANWHENGVTYTISKIHNGKRAYFENDQNPCMLSRLELVDNEHIHANIIRKWISNPAKYIIQCKVDNDWVDINRAMWDYNTQYRLVEKEQIQKWNWCYLDSNNQYAVSSKKYAQKEAEETFGKSLVEKIDSSMELMYNSI